MRYLVTYISSCDHDYRREYVSAGSGGEAQIAARERFHDLDTIVSIEPCPCCEHHEHHHCDHDHKHCEHHEHHHCCGKCKK